MDNEKIKKRIDELKNQNELSLKHLQALETEKTKIIQNVVERNGAIFELERLVKEEDVTKEDDKKDQ